MEGLPKSFFKLQKNLKSFTDGQVSILDQDDQLDWFKVEVVPHDGAYKYGKFEFEIKLEGFPDTVPIINCLTDVYHPNIDSSYKCEDSGNICVSLLDEWDGTHDLEDVVQCLLFLMYNPNLSDPLSSCCNGIDDEQFEEYVFLSLLGRLTSDDHDIEVEFLKPNFHPPPGESLDDYMVLKPLFHDVDFSNLPELTQEVAVTEEGALATESTVDIAINETAEVQDASGVLLRQQSKVEKPTGSEVDLERSSLAVRWGHCLPEVVCRELATVTLSTAVNLIGTSLTVLLSDISMR